MKLGRMIQSKPKNTKGTLKRLIVELKPFYALLLLVTILSFS